MLFLIALLLLLYFHLAVCIRHTIKHQPMQALPSFALMGIGCLGFVMGIGLHIDPAKGVAANAVNWSVWLFLALGIGTIPVAVRKLIALSRSSDRSPMGWRVGLHAWVLAAGLYMVFAVADHLIFFYQDRENAGMANLGFFKAKDVPCQGFAPVLIRPNEGVVRYRCPENIVFGGLWHHDPFVPWPSYTEGSSKELKDALDALNADATRAPDLD